MTVRLMGEGQYRVNDNLRERLNELDNRALAALDAANEVELDQRLDEMFQLVRGEGEKLADTTSRPRTRSSRRAT